MNLLGIDFETTGIDLEKDRIVEAGIVVWSASKRIPLLALSELIFAEDYPESTPEALQQHKLERKQLSTYGVSPSDFLYRLEMIAKRFECEYFCAHNGNAFDKIILSKECERAAKSDLSALLPWIDTMEDLPPDPRQKSKRLTYMAIDHGISVQYGHRALFDVLVMMQIVNCYKIQDIIKNSQLPNYIVQAIVNYHTKELAKPFGFRWETLGNRVFTKKWVKQMKKDAYEAELSKYPFETVIIEDETGESNTGQLSLDSGTTWFP